jgi:alpha-ketoglutarate-dependent taurine dioxygenase
MERLQPDTNLPLVIRPNLEEVDLVQWAAKNQDSISRLLLKHGGVLFRGFSMESAIDFERFIRAISPELLEYRERSSPRQLVSGNIYTSTDYPADQSIFLHNENSYQHTWPLKIFFFCSAPALRDGETPIADCRKVYQRINAGTRERFIQKKIMYVRNFSDGIGLSWQTVFQTSDKAAVNEYCRQAGIEAEWREGNRLRTRQIREAVARHPLTGEMLWFNHATFFHVSTLDPAIRQELASIFEPEDYPNNSYFGDGSQIESKLLDELRAAYRQETVTFAWQAGDILVLDNMLTAHGRAPFLGPRKVLVGMAEPFSQRGV